MIYLGYSEGTDVEYRPGDRPSLRARPALDQARAVTERIKRFLFKVARWEAMYLLPPDALESVPLPLLQETVLQGARGYTMGFFEAESNAIGFEQVPATGQRQQGFRLTCDMAAARRARRGAGGRPFDASWVFYRLDWLANAEGFDVYLWDINLPDGSSIHGATLPEARGTAHRIILADGWMWNFGDQRFVRRSSADLGEIFVHELAIHAYRDARIHLATNAGGSAQLRPGWGHHENVPFHVPGRAGGIVHSSADREADILMLIHRGRPPRFGFATPAQQAQHDQYVNILRDALINVCRGNSSVRGRQLSNQQYNELRLYCPNPAGSGLRLRGPL